MSKELVWHLLSPYTNLYAREDQFGLWNNAFVIDMVIIKIVGAKWDPGWRIFTWAQLKQNECWVGNEQSKL